MDEGRSAPLHNQRALVTGGDSGIGAATAKVLAAAGAKVAVNYAHHPDKADQVVAAIQQAGGDAFAVQADVSDEQAVQAMFRQVIDTWESLDVLVANAGLQKMPRCWR